MTAFRPISERAHSRSYDKVYMPKLLFVHRDCCDKTQVAYRCTVYWNVTLDHVNINYINCQINIHASAAGHINNSLLLKRSIQRQIKIYKLIS